MKPVTVAVLNSSTSEFTPTQLEKAVWAINYQGLYHYNRSPWVEHGYSTPLAGVELHASTSTIAKEMWALELLDTSDQPGALGYHEDQAFDVHSTEGPRKASDRSARGLRAEHLTPLSKVFVKSCVSAGIAVSEVMSHELLEALVDPFVVNEAAIRRYLNAATKTWYIGEVGDPVQGEGYEVGMPEGHHTGPDTIVSNFAYPAWWQQAQTRHGYDFRGTRTAPWQIAPEGYMSVAPESEPSNWSQINGQ